MDLEQAWLPDLFDLKPVITGHLLWTAFWWNDKKKEHCALGLRSALGHIWIVDTISPAVVTVPNFPIFISAVIGFFWIGSGFNSYRVLPIILVAELRKGASGEHVRNRIIWR